MRCGFVCVLNRDFVGRFFVLLCDFFDLLCFFLRDRSAADDDESESDDDDEELELDDDDDELLVDLNQIKIHI